jgi:hypothetical protein
MEYMFKEIDFDRNKFRKVWVEDHVGIKTKNLEWGETWKCGRVKNEHEMDEVLCKATKLKDRQVDETNATGADEHRKSGIVNEKKRREGLS